MLGWCTCPRTSTAGDVAAEGAYQRHASVAAPSQPQTATEVASTHAAPAGKQESMAGAPQAGMKVPRLHLEALQGAREGVLSRISVQQVIEDSTQGKPRPVIKLAHNDTIADALSILAEHRILAAPVMVYPVTTTASGDSDVASSIGVDEDDAHGHTETMVGWADVRELLRAFVVTHANKLALVTGVHSWDSALDAVATDFVRRKLVSVCGDDGQLLPQADTDTMTLLTAVTEGFLSTGGEERTLTPRSAAQCNASSQHLSTTGAALPGGDWPGSEPRGGTGGGAGTFGAEQRSTAGGGAVVHRVALFRGGHICGILSQSDVMAYLWRHHSELLPPRLASAALPDLGFATGRRVVCVTPTTPAHAAFTTMFSYNVSGVGVVDASERLVANLSASDLRRLQPDNFRVLSLPLDAFLDEMQAPGRQPVTVAPSATLLEVVRLLGGGGGTGRLHRVYICDAAGRPVGVITATDVLRMLVRLETEG